MDDEKLPFGDDELDLDSPFDDGEQAPQTPLNKNNLKQQNKDNNRSIWSGKDENGKNKSLNKVDPRKKEPNLSAAGNKNPLNKLQNTMLARRQQQNTNTNVSKEQQENKTETTETNTQGSAASTLKGAAKTLLSKSNNPIDIVKKKILLYIIGAGAGCLGFLLAIIVIILVLVGPIQAVMNVVNGIAGSANEIVERFGNFFTFKGFNTNQETFYNAINERYNYYISRGAVLDVPLIVSTVYIDRQYDPNTEYVCQTSGGEDCNLQSSTNEFVAMRREAIELSDNMVVENGTKYYCTTYKYVPNPDKNNVSDAIPTRTECGSTKAGCQCPVGGTVSPEKQYTIKTDDEYKEYLKTFLWTKLNITEYNKWLDENYPGLDPNSYEGKTKIDQKAFQDYFLALNIDSKINEQIDSIFKRRDLYTSFAESAGLTASNSSSGDNSAILNDMANNQGQIPAALLSVLYNPLTSGSCRQTSCFGFYSSNPTSDFYCKSHNGIDLANDEKLIYSVADGVVSYITDYTKVCDPSSGCATGCLGRSIQIRHTIQTGSTTYTVTSGYYHLSSFADPTWPSRLKKGEKITITKGQVVGTMGTTGCSTGTHLHFMLISGDGKLYNPESLLIKNSCKMDSTCSNVRTYCSSR